MSYRTAIAATAGLLLMNTACDTAEKGSTPTGFDPDRFVNTGIDHGAPDFNWIKQEYLKPAMEEGMRRHLAEVEAIVNSPEPPTFANTIEALERAGVLLDRVRSVFFCLTSANTNEELQALDAELSPKLAAHHDAIMLNDGLFARVRKLYEERDGLGLDPVQLRLLEERYIDFVRGGALLDAAGKERLKAINAELATLSNQFSDNVLAETNNSAVVVDDVARLDGLSATDIAAAAAAAKDKGLEGRWLLPMQNTTQQPVLVSLKDRSLREEVFQASVSRGARGNEQDNRRIVARQAKLRAERAMLLGYPDHATYVLADQMAGSPRAAMELMQGMIPAAVRNARAEAARMQQIIDRQGGGFQVAPWDWAFYAEQVRKADHDLDEAEVRQYLVLDSVLQNGVFHTAEHLFGIRFKPRPDIPVYHPDVRVWEVFDADGSVIGLFYGDFFARPSKHGGAWMSSFVGQSGLLADKPVITNTCNYAKPPAGEPALLTWDDVRTMFHEFGHALHGLLSKVEHPSFSGTSVPRDFVEFPSQFFENWMLHPDVISHYAHHHRTNAPMPKELVEKLRNSTTFDQGYATTEYLAAAVLDMAWHTLPASAPEVEDPLAFEAEVLARHGFIPELVPPRYRTPYFSHIWGGGYSAGYYAYLWAEVLEADAYAWFLENGGLSRATGERYRNTVLAKGNSIEPAQQYRDLTGRDPQVGPLLRKRGLN
jgi:peptidyl-dipeptidase Dcp